MEHSVPYTPQQIGVSETKNRSLKEMEMCLLQAKNLPPYLWDKSVNCASYIKNRVPHKSVVRATPFEALHGNNPDVSHLRVFGSKVWAIIPMHKRKAFQSQSSECILLGYAEDAKEYKLMELASRKWLIKHIVQFEEDHLFDLPPYKAQDGITTLPLPFDDDIFSHVSDSYEEEQDQHDIDIEAEPHENLELDPSPIPN